MILGKIREKEQAGPDNDGGESILVSPLFQINNTGTIIVKTR